MPKTKHLPTQYESKAFMKPVGDSISAAEPACLTDAGFPCNFTYVSQQWCGSYSGIVHKAPEKKLGAL